MGRDDVLLETDESALNAEFSEQTHGIAGLQYSYVKIKTGESS